jgi:adenylate cyclase
MVVGGRCVPVLSGTDTGRQWFALHSLRATGEQLARRSDRVTNELEPRTAGPGEPSPNEAMWRGLLLGTDPRYARTRAWLKHVPSEPRCKMCAAPFEGVGKPLMRLLHRDRWAKNPLYCSLCFNVLDAHHGGAEIEASFLFADVRGSTTLAEGISPTEFRRQLNRFYAAASRVLVEHNAIVDKFVGDEVIGIFIPALAREAHAAQAIEAARELLEATGHADPDGPWLPIGIGVHTGVAYVGSVGVPPVTDLTALGDVVNTTARLASAAATGEILVTQAAAEASHFETTSLERRALELKGKSETTHVFVARVN